MAAVRVLVAATLVLLAFAGGANAETRVALVIGNSAYKNVAPLRNPVNDANAVAKMFTSAGFEVIGARRDLGIAEFRRALRDFSDRARDADQAVVYFAGHGIEVNGENYVIPVDALLERDIDVDDEAISLERIMRVLEPAKKLRMVILDACRDNPFARTMKRTLVSRSIERGLAKVEPVQSDTLVAYAAKAGSTAEDGNGANSTFTSAVLKYLPEPGVDVRIAFGRVRDEVMTKTERRQEPFLYGSLGGGTVALVAAKTAPAPAATAPVAAAPPAAPAEVDRNAGVRRDYELAAQVGTVGAWESFLGTYSSGFYADLARAQLAKLRPEQTKPEQRKAEQANAAEQVSEQDEAARAKKAEEVKAAEIAKTPEPAKVAETPNKIEESKGARAPNSSGVDSGKQAMTLAALTPGNEPVPDVTRDIQRELLRVGCFSSSIDGEWNPNTQRAVTQFNKYASLSLDTKAASLETLETIRGKSTRVCPLICDRGYHAEGDRCIETACRAGFVRGSDGTCERVPSRYERQERTVRPERQERFVRPEPRYVPPAPMRQAVGPEPRRNGGGGGQIACTQGGCQPVPRNCHPRAHGLYDRIVCD